MKVMHTISSCLLCFSSFGNHSLCKYNMVLISLEFTQGFRPSLDMLNHVNMGSLRGYNKINLDLACVVCLHASQIIRTFVNNKVHVLKQNVPNPKMASIV